jgi:hypothetical protein
MPHITARYGVTAAALVEAELRVWSDASLRHNVQLHQFSPSCQTLTDIADGLQNQELSIGLHRRTAVSEKSAASWSRKLGLRNLSTGRAFRLGFSRSHPLTRADVRRAQRQGAARLSGLLRRTHPPASSRWRAALRGPLTILWAWARSGQPVGRADEARDRLFRSEEARDRAVRLLQDDRQAAMTQLRISLKRS